MKDKNIKGSAWPKDNFYYLAAGQEATGGTREIHRVAKMANAEMKRWRGIIWNGIIVRMRREEGANRRVRELKAQLEMATGLA